MKRNSVIIIVIVVLVVIVGGAYALMHKSSKPANSTTAKSTSSNAPAVNDAILVTKTDPTLGQYLAEPNGQALYTYGGDNSGVSNCTGSCISDWPAYQDKGTTTNLPAGVSTIKRTDNGETQYTYNGMPLYTFVSDSNGQVTGNGVSNFSVAKPAAASSASPTPTPAQPAASPSTSSGYKY